MAKKKNPTPMIIGLILVVVGVGLGYWGYQMSESVGSQLTKAVSGAMPDEVMYRYIGGAVCTVVGLFLLIKR